MRVILQRDIVLQGGKHGKKGDIVDVPKEQFHYLKHNGAVVAHRDEAVRLTVPPQAPVKVERTLSGRPLEETAEEDTGEINLAPTPKASKK